MLAMALLNSQSGHVLGHAVWYQVVLLLGSVGITWLAVRDVVGLRRACPARGRLWYWPSALLIVCWSVLCVALTLLFWYNAACCLWAGQPLDIYRL